jgi:tRNA 5-methylaminomethyl-2-thiouridine biosynthesis bifunctional protein
MDAALRVSDHRFNLHRLRALTESSVDEHQPWAGRVGWRCVARDRLPLVGAVPHPGPLTPPLPARPARVPRLPGLYVLGALGSRGLTWAPLLGELLRAWVDGTPMPLLGGQVDALDPARVVLRRARQGTNDPGARTAPSDPGT